MTIFEFVQKYGVNDINQWIDIINKNGLSEHESNILAVADSCKLISCDMSEKPNFVKTLNI
jgi:hypothetical protein